MGAQDGVEVRWRVWKPRPGKAALRHAAVVECLRLHVQKERKGAFQLLCRD